MNEEHRQWIDKASYEDLLQRWRNSDFGDPIFQGESGKYYEKVMAARKEEVGHDAAVQASKNIGWKK